MKRNNFLIRRLTAAFAGALIAVIVPVSSMAQDTLTVQVEDLQRAIALVDDVMDKCFTGSSLRMYDIYDTSTSRGEGTADVWPYTAALEAHCSVMEALTLMRESQPGLYAAHYARFDTRLRNLFDNLAYYKGSFTLHSYAQVASWTVYGVHRSNVKGTATVTGIENVYDDQMWICRELVRAYRLTNNRTYLNVATTLANYCIDGWDCCLDAQGNEYGGISWGPGYNSKHSCSNAPLIQPLVWLSEIYRTDDERAVLYYRWIDADGNRLKEQRKRSEVYADFAAKVYAWQKKNLLDRSTGVYYDMLGADNTLKYVTVNGIEYRTHVDTGRPGGTAYTYNSGTMLCGAAELFRTTGDAAYDTDLYNLSRSCYSRFGSQKRIDGERYRQYPTDSKATSGFNCWFNNVLMRACVDVCAVSEQCRFAESILTDFQTNLDYAWEHFRTDGFLPISLLTGWGDSPVTKGFHQLAFASEYAMLAVWHERQRQAAAHLHPLTEDPFDVAGSYAGVWTLRGQKVADTFLHPSQLPSGIYIVNGRKQWVR